MFSSLEFVFYRSQTANGRLFTTILILLRRLIVFLLFVWNSRRKHQSLQFGALLQRPKVRIKMLFFKTNPMVMYFTQSAMTSIAIIPFILLKIMTQQPFASWFQKEVSVLRVIKMTQQRLNNTIWKLHKPLKQKFTTPLPTFQKPIKPKIPKYSLKSLIFRGSFRRNL